MYFKGGRRVILKPSMTPNIVREMREPTFEAEKKQKTTFSEGANS